MIELTILGSGSSEIRAERGQAGILVRVDDTRLLFDLGAGTLGRLSRVGVAPDDIDAVFVTHGHPDHVSEIVPYLFDMKQRRGATRRDDIVIHGPPAFRYVVSGLLAVFGQWCVGECYDVRAREVEHDVIQVNTATVRAHPVHHSVPAVGYHISDRAGHGVALTGDTGPRDDLVELARDADVLVADCTLGPGEQFDGHLNPEQAGALAARAEVKTLVLSHLSPHTESVDLEGAARSEFSGQVVRAVDLLSIVLE